MTWNTQEHHNFHLTDEIKPDSVQNIVIKVLSPASLCSSAPAHPTYKDFGIVPFDRASDGGVLFLVWWVTIVTHTI